jgi:hypothetical protein
MFIMKGSESLASSIYNLPPEILILIAECTFGPALCSLRLTSRELYRCSLLHFARTVLHTLKIDLSPQAFVRVQKLLKDDVFRPYVQKVEIIRGSTNYLFQGPDWIEPSNFIRGPRGKGLKVWRDVFKRLENCTSFEIRNTTNEHLIPNSDPNSFREALAVLFKVLTADIRMGAFCVDVISNRPRHDAYLTPFDINILKQQPFSHLKELTLAFPDCGNIEWMAALIRQVKTIRKLKIFSCWAWDETPLLNQLMSVDCLPELEDLTFGRMIFEISDVLRFFLYNHRNTIRSVSFCYVQIERGGWAALLRELGSELYDLQSMTLYCAWEAHRPGGPMCVLEHPVVVEHLDERMKPRLSSVPPKSHQWEFYFSYSGQSMREVLGKVASLAEHS